MFNELRYTINMKCLWYLCKENARENNKYCSRKCLTKHCVTKRRQELKLQAIVYKGGKCIKCGYNKSPRALNFHHLDPDKKDFTISSGNTIKWEKIVKELDKCIMVCANCHAEIHEEEYNAKVKSFIQG